MSAVLLVRHAHAGKRGEWNGPDEERPLSPKGRRQADGLVALLQDQPAAEVLSSPAVRCVQTVAPLAAARALHVATDERLMEGRDPNGAAGWLLRLAQGGPVVACTHGDIVPGALSVIAETGVALPASPEWAKGSVWVLTCDGERWTGASYRPPPA